METSSQLGCSFWEGRQRLMIQEGNRLPCLGPSSRLKKQETPAGEETDPPGYGERYRVLVLMTHHLCWGWLSSDVSDFQPPLLVWVPFLFL